MIKKKINELINDVNQFDWSNVLVQQEAKEFPTSGSGSISGLAVIAIFVSFNIQWSPVLSRQQYNQIDSIKKKTPYV